MITAREDVAILAAKPEIDPAAVRETYMQNLAEESERYREGLLEVGIDYVPLNTRQPYDEAFSAYLHRRAKLRG